MNLFYWLSAEEQDQYLKNILDESAASEQLSEQVATRLIF